jgi:hypothetical protein
MQELAMLARMMSSKKPKSGQKSQIWRAVCRGGLAYPSEMMDAEMGPVFFEIGLMEGSDFCNRLGFPWSAGGAQAMVNCQRR